MPKKKTVVFENVRAKSVDFLVFMRQFPKILRLYSKFGVLHLKM